jgi:hypothetical protein
MATYYHVDFYRSSKLDCSDNVLPLLVFPFISALGIKYLFILSFPPKLQSLILSKCSPGSSAAVQYTGINELDKALCGISVFFNETLEDADARAYTIELLTNMSPISALILLEAGRGQSRSTWLPSVCATLVGFAYQYLSGTVILPFCWLYLIITKRSLGIGTLSHAYAEATLFAFFVGFLIPATAVFVMQDPEVTVLWQQFPVWMFLGQRLHLIVRPDDGKTSGRRTAQILYVLTFVMSALPHLNIVWPVHDDPIALWKQFSPQQYHPDEPITLLKGAYTFLKWDGLFIAGSALLATMWFAQSFFELMVLLLWNVSATLTVGPGAALSVVYIWREERITPL